MSETKPYSPVAGSEHRTVPGASMAGPADPDEEIKVTVVVRRRPSANRQEVISEIYSRPPGQRRYLTHDELAAQHGADPADLTAVMEFAQENGLAVLETSTLHRDVVLRGRVAAFSSAFRVELSRYQHQGRTYRDHAGPVQVPAALADVVVAVLGLDNRPVGTRRPVITGEPPEPNNPVGLLPDQVAQLYSFPPSTGQGQCIGIIEFGGGYTPVELGASGISASNVVTYTPSIDDAVNNVTNIRPGAQEDFEVAMDIEIAAAVASDAKIVVYFAPLTAQGWHDAVKTAIYDTTNNPSVISISWGGAEGYWSWAQMWVVTAYFRDAAFLGITICCSSGDDGASGDPWRTLPKAANVIFPASSPNALACGGTTLTLDRSGTRITSEVAWNNNLGATGGGISDVFLLPVWQNGIGVPSSINPGHRVGRGVPDVSANADPRSGYSIYVQVGRFSGAPAPGYYQVGGTSAAAPLWAALVARLNEALGHRVGFLNPAIYGFPAGSRALVDITSGGNGGYQAVSGWDACTGMGSPGPHLLSTLRGLWPDGQVINITDGTLAPLAACVFQNQLYLFWTTNDPSNIYYTSVSGWPPAGTWPNGQQINNVDSTPAALAACVFQNRLYLFWKANDPSNAIYYSASANGQTWPRGQRINTVDSTPAALAACVFQNRLYLFWKANDPSNAIYYSASANGQTWPRGQRINTVDRTPTSLAAQVGSPVAPNALELFWTANDPSNAIYYSASANGQTWPQGQWINYIDATPGAPAACYFPALNSVFVFWEADGPIYYSAAPIVQ
jgi:kumamolisin